MTVRRASFFGLVGLVFAFWIAAIGCALDPYGYGEAEDVCTLPIHCDDQNVCTVDACGTDGICVHSAVDDGDYPDGVQGNCKIFKCESGTPNEAVLFDDVDDGNECTDDSCDASGDATHTNKPGAACHLLGGLGTCDADGACIVQCGHLDAEGNEVLCDPAPNECTLSYCDKAKGECVVEQLDGVASPGTTPGECGGTYCVKGDPSTEAATANTLCTGTSAVGNPKICSGDGACVDCNTDDQCTPAGAVVSFCFTPKCNNHVCENIVQPDGTTLPGAQQSPLPDCHVKVCSQGVVSDVIDDTDSPDLPDDCTVDNCVNGNVVPTFEPNNTQCGMGATTTCDGAGLCVGCNNAIEDCPDPGPCQAPTCDAGTKVCGTAVDPADVVDDLSDCTTDTCSGTTPINTPLNLGTACGGGTRACDSNGQCLGQTCAGAGCPAGATCVDGVCCNTACNAVCEACSTAAKGGAGLNGLCGVVTSGQDPLDADCGGPQVCNGTTGAAACKLPNGQPCLMGAQCLNAQCIDQTCCNTVCSGLCQACNVTGSEGTCSNIPNGQDPLSECPGVVQCNGGGACGTLLGNGAVCGMASECGSGNCVDGVCCVSTCVGACRACNVAGFLGACTNFAANTDPGDAECPGVTLACDGGGTCKKINGETCAAGSECITNQCKDGVCCNNACTSLCQACNVAGSAGTCSNVPNGTDPLPECTGVTTCNGAGACTTLPTGSPCTANGECSTGFCVDFFCCGAACSLQCQGCANAITNQPNGTCAAILSNTDPNSDCTGSQVCNGTTGAGACKKINGDTCAGNTECLSVNCKDGVCCNGACGGACQACNLVGTVGTCTPIPNGQDPASECAGATSCDGNNACALFAVGQTCGSNAECANNQCVDARCCGSASCGTCFTCNGGTPGTCTAIALDGTDNNPIGTCTGNNSCDGSGGCKKNDGQTCPSGLDTECVHGHCVDGFCCNSACNQACDACSAALTPSANGVCDKVDTNTDPGDLECPGAQVCSMVGTCVDGPNGSPCPTDGNDNNCASGDCVDGVCCSTMNCNGICKSCNQAFTTGAVPGVCDNIALGQDPQNECAMACNGAGACQ